MANLTEEEKDALRAITIDSGTDYQTKKAFALMAFIYTLTGYFILKG